MNTWKKIHDEFKALMEDEDEIVRQRESGECGYAYITVGEAGEFEGWIEGITTERLQARFETLATEAGIALGASAGTPPITYWLRGLYLDLRASSSDLVRSSGDRGGFIDRLFEASVIYCSRLERQSLENQLDVGKELSEAIETAKEESVPERSERRRAVVLPILGSKKWSRGKWASKAGVGKNSVYEYLSGKRDLGIQNRTALAEELGLKPEDLPD